MDKFFESNDPNSLGALEIVKILTNDRQATVIFTSRSMHVGYINQAMMKLWNLKDSVLGKKLVEFAPEYTSFIPILEEVWETGIPYIRTDTFADLKGEDGKLVSTPLDFAFQPILDSYGKTYAIIDSAINVEDRVRISNELNEKAIREEALNERLSYTNQKLDDVNRQLNSLNEEYISTNEELNDLNHQLAALNEEYMVTNDELNTSLEDTFRLNVQLEKANSHLKELNSELEKNRNQLANALQAANLGSYNLDLQSLLMECSDQCKTNFGIPIHERFDFSDLMASIAPDYKEGVKRLISGAIANHTPYNAEYQILWPDGSVQWIQANGTPHYDENETPVAMIGVTQLTTDKKNFQAKKDEFLSVASHELKTPITVLKANLQLMDRYKSRVEDRQLPS